jgi:hypothetical protein
MLTASRFDSMSSRDSRLVSSTNITLNFCGRR